MTTNTITVTGNLTRDPEIRYARTGTASATFAVAVNRRWLNRTTNEWEESTSFFDCVSWGDQAENAALSLAKGNRVVVTGRLEQHTWETDESESRTRIELIADEIGASLRHATVQITKTTRPATEDVTTDI